MFDSIIALRSFSFMLLRDEVEVTFGAEFPNRAIAKWASWYSPITALEGGALRRRVLEICLRDLMGKCNDEANSFNLFLFLFFLSSSPPLGVFEMVTVAHRWGFQREGGNEGAMR